MTRTFKSSSEALKAANAMAKSSRDFTAPKRQAAHPLDRVQAWVVRNLDGKTVGIFIGGVL